MEALALGPRFFGPFPSLKDPFLRPRFSTLTVLACTLATKWSVLRLGQLSGLRLTVHVKWHGAVCYQVLASGFSARNLAVACAIGSATRPIVDTDSKSVYRVAAQLIDQLRSGVTPTRPQENKDLWAFFLTYLRGTDVDCVQVHWVKGQLNYRNAAGVTKIQAWFSH
jgi:hypothetical protein